MIIDQVSVFLQNEAGRLVNITEALERANVNIDALSISETEEYGIVRLIFSDTEAGIAALREAGFTTKVTKINCLEVPDVPGELNRILRTLANAGINVSYMYGYSRQNRANLVVRTSDPEMTEAVLAGK